jgi:hypothetical protein
MKQGTGDVKTGTGDWGLGTRETPFPNPSPQGGGEQFAASSSSRHGAEGDFFPPVPSP